MLLATRALTTIAFGSILAFCACERRSEPTDMGARPTPGTPDETGTDTRPSTPVDTRPAERMDPMVPTEERTTANDPAVRSIARARCAHEEKCQNVGEGKTHATRDTCETKLLTEVGDELKQASCPGGILQKELDECLAEIKNEDCKNPIDKLERLAACRSSDMCKAIN